GRFYTPETLSPWGGGSGGAGGTRIGVMPSVPSRKPTERGDHSYTDEVVFLAGIFRLESEVVRATIERDGNAPGFL
ncbi:MAG TPA: hypothetical protein PLN20_07035, partial [Thermotogota bacterium]|nr:hypothetical protein [Thermotogota bacterium]